MFGIWRLNQGWRRLTQWRRLRVAERAVAGFPKVSSKRSHGLAVPLIVSLTSYPARFPTLAKTLKSLLDQNVVTDRTILWVGYGDIENLPAEVRMLEAHGLEIRSCEDFRSFNKLVPALREFPDCAIVTADDDIYYWPEWLGQLTTAAQAAPGAIIAHRCHLALLDADGSFQPYATWPMATADRADNANGVLFPTGVGGVLYPPGALHPSVIDNVSFRAICPRADDVWFFWMARLANTCQVGLGNQKTYISWKGTQEIGLLHKNWFGGENDEQIEAMQERFGNIIRSA